MWVLNVEARSFLSKAETVSEKRTFIFDTFGDAKLAQELLIWATKGSDPNSMFFSQVIGKS